MIDGRIKENDRLRYITEPIAKVNKTHLKDTVRWLKTFSGAKWAAGELLARALAQVIVDE